MRVNQVRVMLRVAAVAVAVAVLVILLAGARATVLQAQVIEIKVSPEMLDRLIQESEVSLGRACSDVGIPGGIQYEAIPPRGRSMASYDVDRRITEANVFASTLNTQAIETMSRQGYTRGVAGSPTQKPAILWAAGPKRVDLRNRSDMARWIAGCTLDTDELVTLVPNPAPGSLFDTSIGQDAYDSAAFRHPVTGVLMTPIVAPHLPASAAVALELTETQIQQVSGNRIVRLFTNPQQNPAAFSSALIDNLDLGDVLPAVTYGQNLDARAEDAILLRDALAGVSSAVGGSRSSTVFFDGSFTFTERSGFFRSVDYGEAPIRSTTGPGDRGFVEDVAYGPTPIAGVLAADSTLLVPFAVRDLGFDTGIALANTTADPFSGSTGTPAPSGSLRVDFFPANSNAPGGSVPGTGAPTANAPASVAATGNPVSPDLLTFRIGIGDGVLFPVATLNPQPSQAAATDSSTQGTVAVLHWVEKDVVMSRATPGPSFDLRGIFAALVRPAAGRFARAGAASPNSTWRPETQTGAAPATAATPSVKVFVTSLGTLGADAFRVTLVNDSGAPIRIGSSIVALEPLARVTERDLQRELAGLSRFQQRTFTLAGYCLAREKAAPAPGMVFRVAPAATQSTSEPLARIVDTALRLRDQKALNPDIDPDDYYHSVVQWAIWTEQEKFDQRAFVAAFTAYTRKNVESGKQRWTRDLEEAVREIATDRWRDVSRIVDEARKASSARTIK
jgi:hypothetical protein